MSANDMSEEETRAIEHFRNVLRETLDNSQMNNFYDRVHVLLYNRRSLLREWIEISTINAIDESSGNNNNNAAQVQEQREQEQQDAMSESLTRHMRAFIRERSNFHSIRGRVSRNEQWGLGISLLDNDDNIRAFLPLERVQDFDDDHDMIELASNDGHDTVENVGRTSTPNEDYRELLLSELENTDEDLENNRNNDDTNDDEENVQTYDTGNDTPMPPPLDNKLGERVTNLYKADSSFFRMIRNIEDYELSLPSDVEHKMPKVPCVLRYLQLRSEYYTKMSTLSRMAIAYPCKQTYDARVATFAKHDGHVIKEITPAKYAEAGFFSYGEHDAVTCYFCAGTIANWLPQDDPWQIHASLFPDCMYVYLKRGKNYIRIQVSGRKDIGPFESAKPVNEDKTRYECKICCSAEISVVFKPCEHMITCYDCAPLFSTCPWCKTTIFDAVRCILPT